MNPMSRRREHAPARLAQTGSQHDELSPGRRSRSAQLDAPRDPVSSGLVGRKARDDHGVTDDVSSTVDSAAPNHLVAKHPRDAGGDTSFSPDWEIDIGVTPDPRDPFEQPPTDWDRLASAIDGPDKPAEWVGLTHVPLRPLPWLRADGKPCSAVTSDKQDDSHAALATFSADYKVANTSWNNMVPGIVSFAEASHDLEGKGPLGSEGGMGWSAGDPGADLSTLTGQQKVGPDNTTIAHLFTNKDGSTGTKVNVDAEGAKATKKTKGMLNSARRAANEVQTAVREHHIAQNATAGTAEGVRAAVLLVEINEAQVDEEELQEEKERLQKEKEEAVETLDTVITTLEALVLIGFGIGEGIHGGAAGAESILIGGLIGAEVIGKAIYNAKYDDKIEAADRKIKTAISGIRSKQKAYVMTALNSAKITHDAAMARVRTTRETMLQKVAAYQSAYDAFAEEAGKAAGGGARGAQIQAALEAVPRVEYCLGQISQICSSIRTPFYMEGSGKGYNGFGKPAEFTVYLGQMKGYRGKFKDLETMWKARLVSLKVIEKRFGP